jgi:(S)-2-hydroxyglutarate dehydrogenase
MKSIVIVGGGIVGLATAVKLQSRLPQVKITILEKESEVGRHQSTHNSGVLHCGLYYQPGSLKAKLAVQGVREMVAFCREHDIPHDVCGKLVVATDQDELTRLDELVRRGLANGLSGLRRLDKDQIRKLEPHSAGIAAVHVPEEGIVDYRSVCDVMANKIQSNGGRVVPNSQVRTLEFREGEWTASCDTGEWHADCLINTAGLYCDRVCKLAGERPEVRIIPFRGEYYRLRDEALHLCRNLIYPVPNPAFPFLGVHFTRMIHGGVEAGPNAVLAFSREGYRRRDIRIPDVLESLTYEGLWRFLLRYPAMAMHEMAQSLSRAAFCRSLQRLVPEIRSSDLVTGGSGVRAQAMTRSGELVQDFRIVQRQQAIHVLNAPSPAATASLAIGGHIASMIES